MLVSYASNISNCNNTVLKILAFCLKKIKLLQFSTQKLNIFSQKFNFIILIGFDALPLYPFLILGLIL
jgi:hypothetical protein